VTSAWRRCCGWLDLVVSVRVIRGPSCRAGRRGLVARTALGSIAEDWLAEGWNWQRDWCSTWEVMPGVPCRCACRHAGRLGRGRFAGWF